MLWLFAASEEELVLSFVVSLKKLDEDEKRKVCKRPARHSLFLEVRGRLG